MRNVLIIGLMIIVGYLVGVRFQAGVIPALACVVLVAAFGLPLAANRAALLGGFGWWTLQG